MTKTILGWVIFGSVALMLLMLTGTGGQYVAAQDGSETATPDPNAPGDYVGTLVVEGALRGYFLHIPENYDPSVAVPLLLSYHGFTGDPVTNAQETQFSRKADEEGFIVVYPAGQREPMGWYTQPNAEEAGWYDDVAFTGAMLDYFEERFNIDPNRIYIAGFSNGGGMAHRLACDFSDRIAAFASVVGPHFIGDPCEITEPVSMIGFYGKRDRSTKYEGYYTLLMPIPEWAAGWVERNGCDAEAEVMLPEENIQVERWTGCDANTEVILRTYELGQHEWYAGATDLIWEFFEAQPKLESGEE